MYISNGIANCISNMYINNRIAPIFTYNTSKDRYLAGDSNLFETFFFKFFLF